MNFTFFFCFLSNCRLYIKEAHCKILRGKKKTKPKRNSELPRNVQLLHLKKVLKYTYKHAGHSPPPPSPFSSNNCNNNSDLGMNFQS